MTGSNVNNVIGSSPDGSVLAVGSASGVVTMLDVRPQRLPQRDVTSRMAEPSVSQSRRQDLRPQSGVHEHESPAPAKDTIGETLMDDSDSSAEGGALPLQLLFSTRLHSKASAFVRAANTL